MVQVCMVFPCSIEGARNLTLDEVSNFFAHTCSVMMRQEGHIICFLPWRAFSRYSRKTMTEQLARAESTTMKSCYSREGSPAQKWCFSQTVVKETDARTSWFFNGLWRWNCACRPLRTSWRWSMDGLGCARVLGSMSHLDWNYTCPHQIWSCCSHNFVYMFVLITSVEECATPSLGAVRLHVFCIASFRRSSRNKFCSSEAPIIRGSIWIVMSSNQN